MPNLQRSWLFLSLARVVPVERSGTVIQLDWQLPQQVRFPQPHIFKERQPKDENRGQQATTEANMEDEGHKCPHCDKVCKSQRGLNQHLYTYSSECGEKELESVTIRKSGQNGTNLEGDEASPAPEATESRRSKRIRKNSDVATKNRTVFPARNSDGLGSRNSFSTNENPEPEERYPSLSGEDPSDEDNNQHYSFMNYDEDDDDMSVASVAGSEPNAAEPEPNTQMMEEFAEFVDKHSDNHLRLTNAEKTSIRLLDVLKRKKTPLNAFPEMLEWHLKETGHLEEHETLKDSTAHTHRGPLLEKLMKRHNLTGLWPKERKVTLPSSKVVASIPCRDAKECILSLLTDPRLKDEDYLFWGDNPFAPPPESVEYIEDLNTGEAHLKTHKEMITKPNQILLMVPMYIDGATTGQFSDLPITALKLTLGIFKRETREKPWAWRELGWVPQIRKQRARGKKLLQEANHMESQEVHLEAGEGDQDSDLGSTDGEEGDVETDGEEDEDTDVKAQDFHTMLSTILESFVDLQRTGFKFDLVWKGKRYKDAEFIVVVPFIKCDTEEGDLLCGKYLCRTGNVRHICRYCHTPSDKADDPMVRIRLKTQPEIQKLVEKGKLDKLQQISQQYIKNAWYKVTFHKANECGIHGACPSEMLHALLLGTFKYVRDIFFKYMGTSSQLAEDIDGLAKEYGSFLNHQSSRDKPETNFSKGISQGKLMGLQYRGVLLIMAAVLRSSKGRELLMKRKRFGKKEGLKDWSMLVELLLEWEAYLCERKMKREHVVKLKQKHKVLLHLLKAVAQRKKGRQWKLMKFHAVLHLVADILLYGVPKEIDTGSNESHHKPSKHAAKLTQRKESTFNIQTAERLTEFLCIDLAKLEVDDGDCVWEYFDGAEVWDPEVEMPNDDDEGADSTAKDGDSAAAEVVIKTSGARMRVFEDEENDNRPTFQLLGRSKTKAQAWMIKDVTIFLCELQNKVIDCIPQEELQVWTEHQRDSVVFRAHPLYRGNGSWRDWVLVDWGKEWGVLPCKIWCFVDLSNADLPTGKSTIQHGDVDLKKGVYAVVECGDYSDEDDDIIASDLFQPLSLEVEEWMEDGTARRKLYMADVEAFKGPCIVIPDIGGYGNEYFQVKDRSQWTQEFVAWLCQPHKLDEKLEESDSDEEETNKRGSKKKRKRSKK